MGFCLLFLFCSLIVVVFFVSCVKVVVLFKVLFFYIFFVVVDDFGWSDVGFYGLKIEILNIDGLVVEGVELDNYYVLLVCIFMRSVFMIGRYLIYIGKFKFFWK